MKGIMVGVGKLTIHEVYYLSKRWFLVYPKIWFESPYPLLINWDTSNPQCSKKWQNSAIKICMKILPLVSFLNIFYKKLQNCTFLEDFNLLWHSINQFRTSSFFEPPECLFFNLSFPFFFCESFEHNGLKIWKKVYKLFSF